MKFIKSFSDILFLVALVLFYPVAGMIILMTKATEQSYFQWLIIVLCIGLIALASEGAIRTRRRIKCMKEEDLKVNSELIRGASAILLPLALIAMSQHIFRNFMNLHNDADFISMLGYSPSEDGFFHLGLLGTIWVVLIAYIAKYHWDHFIELREKSRKTH